MSTSKTRIRKQETKQGVDTLEFELTLVGKNITDLPKQTLINKQGYVYGSVETHNGKAILNLNLPKYVRNNNLEPYTLSEHIKIELIKNDCEMQLKKIFGANMYTKVTKIEVNITQKVSGNATVSDVLNLLSHATLSKEFDNVKYVGRNQKENYELKEENHTIITRRRHYWIGKFYNKSEQIIKERLRNKQPIEDVPRDLLRIEIIMIDRTLKRLFGYKSRLSDVFTLKNLVEILREYKRIFERDLVEKSILPYLTDCKDKLLESLTHTENPMKTIAKERELIIDAIVFQKALQRYMKMRGKADNSVRDIKRYIKQYDLPVDCIKTISEFKHSCG